MEWSHTLLGQYNIGADTFAIDFARNFLDPQQARLAHIHESIHAVLSRVTDMGLASKPVFAHIGRFSHLDKADQAKMIRALIGAQILPQEGFASFMEYSILALKNGPKAAMQYVKEKFPQDYYDRFLQLHAVTKGMSKSHREHYTQKVPQLALETDFRRIAPSLDLLRRPDVLEKHIQDPNRNPSIRLQKINEMLLAKPWMVTKPIDEIAEAAGIDLYEPATKEEVAAYMNYIASLANLTGTYTAEMVGDAPGREAVPKALNDAILTNINHNLSTDAGFLLKEEDIRYEINNADCAMFDIWPYHGDRERTIEQASKLKPETSFLLFRRTGEKYIGFVPMDLAHELIEGPLRKKPLLTKPDRVDIVTGTFEFSEGRLPDVVYYDHLDQLQKRLEENKKKITQLQYVHLGTVEDHPYRIVIVRVNGKHPLHVVNTLGSGRIVGVLENLGVEATQLPKDLVVEYKDALNDYFGFMGLPWQLDWVDMIVNQSGVKHRHVATT